MTPDLAEKRSASTDQKSEDLKILALFLAVAAICATSMLMAGQVLAPTVPL